GREDGALTAPNRALGIRAAWSPQGLHIAPRTVSAAEMPGSSAGARIRATALARGNAKLPLGQGSFAPGRCASRGGVNEYGECLRRVEATQAPGVIEWWENRPDGLEQGFTINTRPLGKGGAPLQVVVEIDAASVSLDSQAQSVTLKLTSGPELIYS